MKFKHEKALENYTKEYYNQCPILLWIIRKSPIGVIQCHFGQEKKKSLKSQLLY